MAYVHICDCCGNKAPKGELLPYVSFSDKKAQTRYDPEPFKTIKRIELCADCFARLLFYVEENFEKGISNE